MLCMHAFTLPPGTDVPSPRGTKLDSGILLTSEAGGMSRRRRWKGGHSPPEQNNEFNDTDRKQEVGLVGKADLHIRIELL